MRLFADVDSYDPWGMKNMTDTDERREVIRRETLTCSAADRDGPGACELDENTVHWHAWDFDLMREAVEGCLGYELLVLNLQPPMPPSYCPWHQMLVARKAKRPKWPGPGRAGS